jgi:hypothetical protein
VLRQDQVKFGVKVGIGAALFALPAFIPATRPTFSHWRGEWGLVSYMIIMSMTLGQTNNSGEARVVGTIIGSLLALTAWIVFPENPYALSAFGWLVSLPCFWIILNWKQATFGRFILLTYNLSALYAYSISLDDNDDDDDEGGGTPFIMDIVLHRTVAVTAGVLWGLFINRMIWPISARSQLRKGLSVLWLRMALIWNQDPLNCLIDGHHEKQYKNITEEYSLQKTLIQLNSLAAAAPHEFRLKGPFPTKEYQAILKSSQAILDAFHGMSVMIAKDPKANRRETDILNFTKKVGVIGGLGQLWPGANVCFPRNEMIFVRGSVTCSMSSPALFAWRSLCQNTCRTPCVRETGCSQSYSITVSVLEVLKGKLMKTLLWFMRTVSLNVWKWVNGG